MRIAKSFGIVAGLTLASNALGYIRDATLGAKYGISTVTDAYFAAFFVPNTLYLILLAGGISTAFVPVFVHYLQQDEKEAWSIASTVFNLSFLLLIAIILLCGLTAPTWMSLLFPGFDESTTELASRLTLIMLPMLLFIGLSSLLTVTLNSFEHFTIPAVAPLVANTIVILFIIASHYLGGIEGVAVGVFVGMLAQLLIQIPMLRKYGVRYSLTIDIHHPALARIGKLVLPLILYLILSYASLVIERNIASTLAEGTLSALNYATRLFSLPIVFFAGSLGTIIYPRLSFEASRDDSSAFSSSLLDVGRVCVFFLLPISVWMAINSRLVVDLLFGYGEFSAENVQLTALMLSGYTLGMVATGLSRILQRALYALEDTVTPLRAELITLVFYVGLSITLSTLFGAVGLAAARGLSFIIVVLVYIAALRKHRQVNIDVKKILLLSGRYLVATAAASTTWSLFSWGAGELHFLQSGRLAGFILLVLTTVAGGLTYLLVSYAFKVEEVKLARNAWIMLKAKLVNPGT